MTEENFFGPSAAFNTLRVSWFKLQWIKLVGKKIKARTTKDYDLKGITVIAYLYKGKYYLVDYKEEDI